MRNLFTPGFLLILGGAAIASTALAGWLVIHPPSLLAALPGVGSSPLVLWTAGLGFCGAVFMTGALVMRRIDRRRQALLEGTLQTRTAALADERAISEILLENSRDAFLVWNTEGCIQHASPSAEVMFGWRPGELLGRSLRGILDPQHYDDYDRMVEESHAGTWSMKRVNQVLILYGHRRDGSRFPFEMIPYETTVGGRPAVAAMLRDVTERMRSEETRRRSESLRAVMEELPDVVVVHRNRRLIYVNQRFLDILGYKHAEEVLGRSIRDFIHPDAWEKVVARLDELRSRGKPPERAEEQFVTRAGEVVTLEVAKVPVVFDARVAVAAIGRDVSGRRMADRRFRQAVESSPSGMIMIDSEGRIVLANSHVEHLFGYRESELQGESIEVLLPER